MGERWRVRARINGRESERDGNIGKQSFNGAENNENGETEGGEG